MTEAPAEPQADSFAKANRLPLRPEGLLCLRVASGALPGEAEHGQEEEDPEHCSEAQGELARHHAAEPKVVLEEAEEEQRGDQRGQDNHVDGQATAVRIAHTGAPVVAATPVGPSPAIVVIVVVVARAVVSSARGSWVSAVGNEVSVDPVGGSVDGQRRHNVLDVGRDLGVGVAIGIGVDRGAGGLVGELVDDGRGDVNFRVRLNGERCRARCRGRVLDGLDVVGVDIAVSVVVARRGHDVVVINIGAIVIHLNVLNAIVGIGQRGRGQGLCGGCDFILKTQRRSLGVGLVVVGPDGCGGLDSVVGGDSPLRSCCGAREKGND